mmetsp:Transcript_3918/g.14391  ORF Transcript_3918/g.14391 Transcript_3918/m.14391 type:complete len:131 (-) Transcript_3918:1853-2245(-)
MVLTHLSSPPRSRSGSSSSRPGASLSSAQAARRCSFHLLSDELRFSRLPTEQFVLHILKSALVESQISLSCIQLDSDLLVSRLLLGEVVQGLALIRVLGLHSLTQQLILSAELRDPCFELFHRIELHADA